jgi:hypothetical protein
MSMARCAWDTLALMPTTSAAVSKSIGAIA